MVLQGKVLKQFRALAKDTPGTWRVFEALRICRAGLERCSLHHERGNPLHGASSSNIGVKICHELWNELTRQKQQGSNAREVAAAESRPDDTTHHDESGVAEDVTMNLEVAAEEHSVLHGGWTENDFCVEQLN